MVCIPPLCERPGRAAGTVVFAGSETLPQLRSALPVTTCTLLVAMAYRVIDDPPEPVAEPCAVAGAGWDLGNPPTTTARRICHEKFLMSMRVDLPPPPLSLDDPVNGASGEYSIAGERRVAARASRFRGCG